MKDSMKNPAGKLFRVGDTVRAYRKGIHIIERFENGGSNGLVHYRTIITDNLSIIKAKTVHVCDIAYCGHVDATTLEHKRDEQVAKYATAISYLNSLK